MQVPVTLLKGEGSTSVMLVVEESQMLRPRIFSELGRVLIFSLISDIQQGHSAISKPAVSNPHIHVVSSEDQFQ
jgi:hypothetical protein